ncbi:MAG: M36 family metallopeptidase, partial [Actinomycetes bacterium]|nr:M36 family metallopeptidase [Actinomycetes bacterium]MDX5400387.1 M36 family metallopeptidase [Actinomycetes bacterium]
MTAVVQEDGSLTSIAGFLATGRGTPGAQLTAHEALDIAAAAQDANPRRPLREANNKAAERRTYPNVYAEGVFQPTPVSTELVWYPAANGRSLRLAWLTDIESSGQAWYETVVDAKTGAVIQRMSRYAHASPEGNVYQEQHPEIAGAAQQITPFTGLDGSWVDDRTTSGNNVNAYLDRNDDDANNEYQPETPASGDPGYQHFNYTFTDAWRTTADVDSVAALDADRDAIITQLFYYTNVMHDWLYGHGFDEASGNFQVDNFGRGGSGGDPVLAEAQDGYDFGCDDGDGTPNETEDRCRNNANFGTPADGASPRMQMYMWIPSRPFRDGDMDGDVIAHEYGHGVSSRLVGGGTLGYDGSDQRGALGEGWSDVISYLKWGDAVIGEYVTGNT